MLGLTKIGFKFNEEELLSELNQWKDSNTVPHYDIPEEYHSFLKDITKVQEDERHPEIKLPVANEEVKRFGEYYQLEDIDERPRYYIQQKNGFFPPHIDLNTPCAVNTVLSDTNVPVWVGARSWDIKTEAKEAIDHIKYQGDSKKYLTPYEYKTGILDTTRIHMVDNRGHDERLLFKISFFNTPYEELVKKILSIDAIDHQYAHGDR